jgi:hypothetical protein
MENYNDSDFEIYSDESLRKRIKRLEISQFICLAWIVTHGMPDVIKFLQWILTQ